MSAVFDTNDQDYGVLTTDCLVILLRIALTEYPSVIDANSEPNRQKARIHLLPV